MVMLVHWKEMIDKDFIVDFINVVKDIVEYEKNYINATKPTEKYLRTKYTAEVIEKTLRYLKQIKECGYEEQGDILKKFGWYYPYVDWTGQLKFHTTADPERTTYITKDEYFAFLREWKRKMAEKAKLLGIKGTMEEEDE